MRGVVGQQQYQLRERIAVGGMAEIYLGTAGGPEGFERPVVIKKIHPRYGQDPRFVEMLINEAKITARLNHVNVVQILDLGRGGDGEHFIVMEYVQGKDLRDVFDRAQKRGIPLPRPTMLYILAEVCEGLDYAHRLTDGEGQALRLIHRDVSPSNVLLSEAGEVKLTDFGVARFGRDASQVGSLKGKLGYMAPEQARGEPLDHRSDVFSVGAILFEALLGQRVFEGKNDIEMLYAVRGGVIPAPSSILPTIDSKLERILLRAVAAERDERFASAAELASELRGYLFDELDARVGPKELADFLRQLFDGVELQRANLPAATGPLERRLTLATLDGFRSPKRGFVESSTARHAVAAELIEQTRAPAAERPARDTPASDDPLERRTTSPSLSTSDELALLRVITDLPSHSGSYPSITQEDLARADDAQDDDDAAQDDASEPSKDAPKALLDLAVPADPDEAVTTKEAATRDSSRGRRNTPMRDYSSDEISLAFEDEVATTEHERGLLSLRTDPERPAARLGVRAGFESLGPVLRGRIAEAGEASKPMPTGPTAPLDNARRKPMPTGPTAPLDNARRKPMPTGPTAPLAASRRPMPTGPAKPLVPDGQRKPRLTGPVLPTGLANVPELFADAPVTVVSDPDFTDDFGSFVQDEPGGLETKRPAKGRATPLPNLVMRDDDEDEAPTSVHPFEGVKAGPIVAVETVTGRTAGFDPDDQPTVLREQDLSQDWGPVAALPESGPLPAGITHTAEVPPKEESNSSLLLWLTMIVIGLAIAAIVVFVHLTMRSEPSSPRATPTAPRTPNTADPTPAPLPQTPTLPANK